MTTEEITYPSVLITDAHGKVLNRVVEDPENPIAVGGDERIVRGMDSANIGDTIQGGQIIARVVTEEPNPLEDWSRNLDAAKSIAAIKQVIQEHPSLGYIPATEDEQTEVD